MTQPDLARLEGLLAKATPAPWSIAADELTECFVINGANQIVPLWEENDLTMIVALVNAFPALLARVRELTEALEDIRLAVEDEAYKVTDDQQSCKHTDALNEIHEIAALTLNKEPTDAG